jgi:hypothetical protein
MTSAWDSGIRQGLNCGGRTWNKDTEVQATWNTKSKFSDSPPPKKTHLKTIFLSTLVNLLWISPLRTSRMNLISHKKNLFAPRPITSENINSLPCTRYECSATEANPPSQYDLVSSNTKWRLCEHPTCEHHYRHLLQETAIFLEYDFWKVRVCSSLNIVSVKYTLRSRQSETCFNFRSIA